MFFDEPVVPARFARLDTRIRREMSVVSYVETGAVMAGRHTANRLNAIVLVDAFLQQTGIVLAPVDDVQAYLALRACVRFGKGMGQRGRPNFGDSFAYALAVIRDAPLLFIGNDFGMTDVKLALSPTH